MVCSSAGVANELAKASIREEIITRVESVIVSSERLAIAPDVVSLAVGPGPREAASGRTGRHPLYQVSFVKNADARRAPSIKSAEVCQLGAPSPFPSGTLRQSAY